MEKSQRLQQLETIMLDTEKRGEEVISDITFFGCIYQVKVRKDGKKKKVNYSSAEKVMDGYRPIIQS